jgi:hypothetical protein
MSLVGIVAPELLVENGLDRFTGLSANAHHSGLYNRVIRSDMTLSQRVSEQKYWWMSLAG